MTWKQIDLNFVGFVSYCLLQLRWIEFGVVDAGVSSLPYIAE
jgi:hypothetical protein